MPNLLVISANSCPDFRFCSPSEASGHPAPTRYAHLAVDEKRSLTFNAIENVIIKRTARCKLVIATRRIKGISKYDYSRYWMSRHVEVIMKQTKFVSYLRGYVQNHAIPGTIRYLNGEPVPDHLQFDGVIEQWFDSVWDAIRAYTTWGYLRNIRADEPNFIDSPHCPFTAVKECVMFTDSSRLGR